MKRIIIELTNEHSEVFHLIVGEHQSREIFVNQEGYSRDAHFVTASLASPGSPHGTLPKPQAAMDYALATFATYSDKAVRK